MLNVLYLYNSTQTFTNTVYEHIACFAKYSGHRSFYAHQDQTTEFSVDLSRFDAVAIHYSIRLPYDQVSPSTVQALKAFNGLKFLFIQDEYDHTQRAWHWIKELGLQLVFTVVPEAGVETVYPAKEFPNTQFVSNLTGYVPDDLVLSPDAVAPSQRSLIVGYRGRPLPIRYGKLGEEKISIGRVVKYYCDAEDISCDIAWSEESRIYGPKWYEFMLSCRSMLGSESGSNVFDWDGTLVKRIAQFRKEHPKASDEEVYAKFVSANEIDGIMNQVSPRVFEAIAAKTVLVLYEGSYSDVVTAGEHFIAVKKDGTNLPQVLALLQDSAYVDAMAERAYRDVIASGKYGYKAFVHKIDFALQDRFDALTVDNLSKNNLSHVSRALFYKPSLLSTQPIQAPVPTTAFVPQTINKIKYFEMKVKTFPRRCIYAVWNQLSDERRAYLKPRLKKLIGREMD